MGIFNLKDDHDRMIGLEQLSLFFVLYAINVAVAIAAFIIELIYDRKSGRSEDYTDFIYNL